LTNITEDIKEQKESPASEPPDPEKPSRGWAWLAAGVLLLVGFEVFLQWSGEDEDRPVKAEVPASKTPVKAEPPAKTAPWLKTAPWSKAALSYELVRIPAGSFQMGSTDGADTEKPVHTVRISSDFYIGKYEVTQGLYEQLIGSNPSQFSSCGSDCPVEKVNWYDAVNLANALSEQEGLSACYTISGTTVTMPSGLKCEGYRLPTEAEWEYAAKAGGSLTYAGSNDAAEVGWYEGNSGSGTHPVGQKKANAFGVYDMSGNVWEWTWDRYEAYTSSESTDPMGPSGGFDRVLRGGGWNYNASSLRSTDRHGSFPGGNNVSGGFRLSRSIP